VKQRKFLGVLAKRSSDEPDDKSGFEGVSPWNKQLRCQGNREVKRVFSEERFPKALKPWFILKIAV
jgi:hypothetical protein